MTTVPPIPHNIVCPERELSKGTDQVPVKAFRASEPEDLTYLRVQDQAIQDWIGSLKIRGQMQPIQVVMATAQRSFAQMRDLQEQVEKRAAKLPMVSISRGTERPAPDRFTRMPRRRISPLYSLTKADFSDNTANQRRIAPWPLPYDTDYLIQIETKTPQDGNLIVRAIKECFNHVSEIFLLVDYGPAGVRIVPFLYNTLDDISSQEPGEAVREYILQMTFTLKGWMPKEEYTTPSIKHVQECIIQQGTDPEVVLQVATVDFTTIPPDPLV